MKRQGELFEEICSFRNLFAAASRARRGKRHRPDVVAFHYNLEGRLLALRDELRSGAYVPGPFRSFRITDPKPRIISAAPYRDRVVHHAICNVIEPVFERRFIFDSYANRTGKGTHQALDRCTDFSRNFRNGYVLKCDVSGYFPSMDHEILKTTIAKTLKCKDTLSLLGVIIDASDEPDRDPGYFAGDSLFTPYERRNGIPIGNLTSQLFGNIYLNGFDHWMMEAVRLESSEDKYIRFVDDFLVFSRDRRRLRELLPRIGGYMDNIRLKLHPRKCQITPVRCGVEFLGWHVFPDHRRLRRTTGVRFQRRLRLLAQEYQSGVIGLPDVKTSVMSWIGHLKHGDTWGLRSSLLAQAAFKRRAD